MSTSPAVTLLDSAVDAMVADRRLGHSSHYPYLLCFVREFTAGNHVGTQHTDSLPVCSASDAQEWVNGINRKAAAGKINYRVAAWAVRPLAAPVETYAEERAYGYSGGEDFAAGT